MPSAFFLAQTMAEIRQQLPKGTRKAWMACHFSPYGTGLSNLPEQLPEGSMVIVNDRTPVAGHDPQRITSQLAQLVQAGNIGHILLDFQRPGEAQTQAIAAAIVGGLACPVGVSELYAKDLPCPVFLPPLPLHMPLADYIAPWKEREIWLEIMPDHAAYTVTENGCTRTACDATGIFPHFDAQACCRYRTEVLADAVRFTLVRGPEELAQLRNCPEITCFVGLYQQFAQPEAQATALDQ